MLERGPDHSKKSFAGFSGEEHLNEFPEVKENPEANRAEYNDLFIEAQSNILSEKTFSLFVRAISEKETTGSNDTLAFLQNRIVQECLNLSERDVALILDQFNRSVREWFVKKYGPSQIDSRVHESIVSGKYTHGEKNIDLRGIWSVISFLKARAALLAAEPAQDFSFYFSGRLDARHSVDVIEEIEEGEGSAVSLIQLKSSIPAEDEMEHIHADHQKWVEEEWMDMEDYEHSYIEDGTKKEIEGFLRNGEKVRDALLDFFTDPAGQNLDRFISSLHLSNLDDKQQAWVLWKYADLAEEPLRETAKEGIEDPETVGFVQTELNALKEKLVKKARLPKSQTIVKRVKSIISVGARIVSEKEIKVGERGKVINVR